MPCGTKLNSNKKATLTPDNLDYLSFLCSLDTNKGITARNGISKLKMYG